LHVTRRARLLQAPHEHVIEIAVLLDLALQDAKLEFLPVNSLDIGLALRERPLHCDLVGAGGFELLCETRDHELDLPPRVLTGAPELGLRRHHPGMLGAVSLRRLVEAPLRVGFLFLHFLNQRMPYYRRHALIVCLRLPGANLLDDAIRALRFGAPGPGLDETPGELLQLLSGTRHCEALCIDDVFPVS